VTAGGREPDSITRKKGRDRVRKIIGREAALMKEKEAQLREHDECRSPVVLKNSGVSPLAAAFHQTMLSSPTENPGQFPHRNAALFRVQQ
jgi:hypothetical protein